MPVIDEGGAPETLGDVVRDAARRHRDRPAIVHGDQRLSYADLDRRSAEFAARLLGDGLGRGGHVGMLLPNGIDFAVALFAAARIGGVAVPLSTLSQPPELRWLLGHGDVEVLVTCDRYRNHDFLKKLEQAIPGLASSTAGAIRVVDAPRLRVAHGVGGSSRCWTGPAAGALPVPETVRLAVEATVGPDDPVLVVHTSGTTSEPKGVVHANRAVAGHSWRMAQHYWFPAAGDVFLSPRPWFWVAGLVADLLYCLQAGVTFVVPTSDDPTDVLATVRRERVTYLGGPSVLSARSPAFADAGLTAVPLAIDIAGVARTDGGLRFVSDDLEARHPAARAAVVPFETLPNLFGMTETLGTHSALPHGTVVPDGKEGFSGPPVPAMEARLTGLDGVGSVVPGEDGLLWVRGESLMLGIHRRRRADVFDVDGWYATGDLCQIDEQGWVRFRSRLGDVVKISGANVAPLEVERVLAGRPDISEVAVLGTAAGGITTLVAAVVPVDGVRLDHDEVRRWAGERLSSYKVPKLVVEVAPEEMPRTASGKVRTDELRRLVEHRLRTGRTRSDDAPRLRSAP